MDEKPRRRRTDEGDRGRVDVRMVYDLVGALRREFTEQFDKLGTRLEDFRRETGDLRHKGRNEIAESIASVRLTAVEEHAEHEKRLRDLESWRAEVKGALSIARFAFGTSLLSAVASLVALWKALS